MNSKGKKGKKPRDSKLSSKFEAFWSAEFFGTYPDKLPFEGLSRLKAILAEQMTSCVLVDTSTRLESRLSKLLQLHLQCADDTDSEETLGSTQARKLKMKSKILAGIPMNGKWDFIPSELTEVARRVLPSNPRKGSYCYDLKCNPSKYVDATYHICREMGEDCNFTFLQLRTCNVPCHVKFDTEMISRLFIPYSRVCKCGRTPRRDYISMMLYGKTLSEWT